jgi:hypothetical protein
MSVDDDLPTSRQFLKKYKQAAKPLFSIQSTIRAGVWVLPSLGKIYRSGRKVSFRRCSIFVAARLNGRAIVTRTKNCARNWVGRRA